MVGSADQVRPIIPVFFFIMLKPRVEGLKYEPVSEPLHMSVGLKYEPVSEPLHMSALTRRPCPPGT